MSTLIQDRPKLMQRMEKTTSADIMGSAINGLAGGLRLGAAVRRCEVCVHKQACGQWLDEHRGQRVAAPSFCANKYLMQPATSVL